MTAGKERIAELYFASGSIKLGEFEITAHQENPDLPKSPYYLHYPDDPRDPGYKLLPEMFRLIGDEFYSLCQSKGFIPKKIAGVPKGAVGLADAHAQHYDGYPSNVLTFDKSKVNGKTVFSGPYDEYEEGDETAIDDDHTSGARNKKLIRATALSGGLVVPYMLTVVDRMQGAVENLAKDGVTLLSIFTIDELLEAGVQSGDTEASQLEGFREYRLANQLEF